MFQGKLSTSNITVHCFVRNVKGRSAATTGRQRIVPRKVHQYRLGLVDAILKRLTFLSGFLAACFVGDSR